MAHLLFIRDAPSFVQPTCKTFYGQDEIIAFNTNERRYRSSGVRSGYNIPHESDIKFKNVRIKKEFIQSYCHDLGGIYLNPHPNTSSLFGCLGLNRKKGVHTDSDGNNSVTATVGMSIEWIQYGFKNFYRVCRFLHRSIVLCRCLIHPTKTRELCAGASSNLYPFPLQPVPIPDKNREQKPLVPPATWAYHYFIGWLKDIERTEGNEEL